MLDELQKRANARCWVMPDSVGKKGGFKLHASSAQLASTARDNTVWSSRTVKVKSSVCQTKEMLAGVNSGFT
jgi:hypothetical protein